MHHAYVHILRGVIKCLSPLSVFALCLGVLFLMLSFYRLKFFKI